MAYETVRKLQLFMAREKGNGGATATSVLAVDLWARRRNQLGASDALKHFLIRGIG